MKKIYYEKVGRRYIPVSEYDNELLDSFPKGNHLVMCYPGGTSRRFNIDPNYAALIAASRVAEDAMTKAISEASEIRREENSETPLTPEQKAAWEHLVKVFGERARYLRWQSARDVADAGLKAIQVEAFSLMKNASVREAYNQFIMICELCKEHNAEVR
jgi:hypothetical protein